MKMRTIIEIPLVHVPFGHWDKERLDATFGKNPDPTIVRQIIQGNREYWDEADTFLEATKIDKVYQEASMVEYSEQEFLERFGQYRWKNRNVDAFFRLLERGAQFVRTESTYARNETTGRLSFRKPDPLEPADSFMAKTIDETLVDGETGVLFLGVEHGVDKILNERYPNITARRFHHDPAYLIPLLESIVINR